jgi:hypothetical protein
VLNPDGRLAQFVLVSVGPDPPNIIAHSSVLGDPAPFPPREHYHCDRRDNNHADHADQHDEVL